MRHQLQTSLTLQETAVTYALNFLPYRCWMRRRDYCLLPYNNLLDPRTLRYPHPLQPGFWSVGPWSGCCQMTYATSHHNHSCAGAHHEPRGQSVTYNLMPLLLAHRLFGCNIKDIPNFLNGNQSFHPSTSTVY